MSVTIITFLYCDGGPLCPLNGTPYSDDAALNRLPAPMQRERFHLDGWRHVGGKDFCPDCTRRILRNHASEPSLANGRKGMAMLRSLDVLEAYLNGETLAAIARTRARSTTFVRGLIWRAYWTIVRSRRDIFTELSNVKAEPLERIQDRREQFLPCIYTLRIETLAQLKRERVDAGELWEKRGESTKRHGF